MSGLGDNVSRETLDQLEDYAAELVRWSKKINLISPSTYESAWSRHIEDSAQAMPFLSEANTVVDFGSGGGLPAIVLAILSKSFSKTPMFTLIESDGRKATFLRQMIQRFELNARVIQRRVEETEPQVADAVTARAITALPLLLEYAQIHLKKGGSAVLHKGRTWEREVTEARKTWAFSLDVHLSTSDNAGAILKIGGLERV